MPQGLEENLRLESSETGRRRRRAADLTRAAAEPTPISRTPDARSSELLQGGRRGGACNARSDLNVVREQLSTSRSQTTSLTVTRMRSRTVREQPLANKVLFLLNTV